MPEGWQLRLPGGIDAESTRALLELLDRWDSDNIGVERVLVWHLASVVEEALPHLAEGLGVDDVAFVGGPPREFLARGIRFMRRRGTPAAVEDGLAAIGYDASVVELEEDTRLYYDGSQTHSGAPLNYGHDAEWIAWRVWIDGDGIAADRLHELWDVIAKANRATRPFVLVIVASDGVLSVYRSRTEIVGPSHSPSGTPTVTIASASHRLFDPFGGDVITVNGTALHEVSVWSVVDGDDGHYECTPLELAPDNTWVRLEMPEVPAGNYTIRAWFMGPLDGPAIKAWSPAQIAGIDASLDATKGVTEVAGRVSAWASEVNSLVFANSGPDPTTRPTRVADVFGSRPAIRFASAHWLQLAARRIGGTGRSFFFVGRWTSSKTTIAGQPINAPLTVIADEPVINYWDAFGAAAGAIRYRDFNASGSGYRDAITGGSGLNDGQARLLGVTTDAVPNRKLYVGATLVESDSPPGGYSGNNGAYAIIGCGAAYADGFDGDIGAIVVVNGPIAPADLEDLHEWARVHLGAVS